METTIEKLNAALLASDERRRPSRIQRIVWISNYERLPRVIVGRAETMHLLREAREVFVDGHFAAALLLAVSVINHSLVEELQLRGKLQKDPGFHVVLAMSAEFGILSEDWVASIQQLVKRRHPFTHLKESDHEHGLGARIRNENSHPSALLEQDARDAIIFMYQVFRATLREV